VTTSARDDRQEQVTAAVAESDPGSNHQAEMDGDDPSTADRAEESAVIGPTMGEMLVTGDLRIAHFIGMHALQALPLLAIAAAVGAAAVVSAHHRNSTTTTTATKATTAEVDRRTVDVR
jgi:hypothetical protein